MTDRPIIFSAPMIAALLAGRKSQTRRLAWSTPHHPGACGPRATVWQRVQPGDRLYVRESFSYDRLDVDHDGTLPPWYWADGNPEDGDWTKPKPSIHCPRWASRLTLTVTEVRRQRLQEITEEDARAEGVDPSRAGQDASGPIKTYRTGFVRIWGELHGADSWLADPEVVALTFTVARRNIDARDAA